MKGYEAIVKVLKLEGIKLISLFQAGGATGIMGTVTNESFKEGIRTVMARKERVAINIADAYTRVGNVSGKIGVAMVGTGVGAENAYSGVSQAGSDLVPMLILVGGNRRRTLGTRVTQNFDTVRNYEPLVKWAANINYADRVPEFMRRAFTYLKTGRPGPVVLEVPVDVLHEEFDDAQFNYKSVPGWKIAGDEQDVKAAVKAFLAAENPLIYAGEGVYYAHALDELRQFAELVQAPVMTTLKAKGVFPENHPLSVGSGGRDGGKPAAHFLKKADLVFCVGASLVRGPGAPILKHQTIIQTLINEYDINMHYVPDYVILGDACLVLKQMIRETQKHIDTKALANDVLHKEIQKVKDEWLAEWMPLLTSDEVPINPYRVIWDLLHTIDRNNSCITHDSGWPRDNLAPFWETLIPRGYIGWGHHSTMGFSLGACLGAKLAEPERTVIQYTGDGSFGMTGMDWEVAARHKIPIITVLINNGGLGHYFHDVPSSAALSGNYAALAKSLGGYGEQVTEPNEIKSAIQRAQQRTEAGQPALLEIMCKLEDAANSKYWRNLAS